MKVINVLDKKSASSTCRHKTSNLNAQFRGLTLGKNAACTGAKRQFYRIEMPPLQIERTQNAFAPPRRRQSVEKIGAKNDAHRAGSTHLLVLEDVAVQNRKRHRRKKKVKRNER